MWTYIIAGLIALAALATITVEVKSYLNGVKESGRIEERSVWQAAAEKRRQQEALASATAAKGLQSDRSTSKATAKTRSIIVEKIIEKPIYRNVCLELDGLQCVNAALGRKGTAGCKLDTGVPKVSGALRWDWQLGSAKVN